MISDTWPRGYRFRRVALTACDDGILPAPLGPRLSVGCIEYASLTNVRPVQGNRSIVGEDEGQRRELLHSAAFRCLLQFTPAASRQIPHVLPERTG